MITDSLRQLLVSDTFSWVACGGIVTFAVLALLVFLVQSSLLAQQLKRGRSILGSVATPREFAERFETLSSDITTRCPRLSHTWNEFCEALRQPDPDDHDPQVTNSRQPALYFNESAIITPAVHPAFHGAVANKLVGLGILFTFVGLAAGIGLASGQLAHEDVAEVKKGLTPLLEGASLAFSTSIAGLLSSLLFSLAYRWRLGRLRRQLQTFNDHIERVVVFRTSEQLGALQLEELRRQTAALDQFNTELAVNIGSAVSQQLNEQLAPRFDALIAALESIRADRRDSNLEALGSMVAQFQHRLDASAGDHFKSLVPVLEKLAHNVDASAGGMRQTTQHLNDASAKMMSSVEATAQRSNASLEAAVASFEAMALRNEELFGRVSRLAQTLETSQTAVHSVNQRLEHVAGAVGSSSQTLRDAAHAQVQAVEFVRSAAKQVNDRAERQDASIEMLASLVGQFQQGVTASTGNIAEWLGRCLETFGATLETSMAGMGQATSHLHEQSGKMLGHFQASAERGTAAIGAALAGFETLTGRHDELLARVNVLASALQGSQSSVREVHAQLGQLSASVGATATTIRDVAQLQVQVVDHVKNAAAHVANASAQSQKDWADYRQRFEGLDQSLGRTFEGLQGGLVGYTQQVGTFAHALDQQIAKAIGDLGGAINLLTETVEDLQETLQGRAA